MKTQNKISMQALVLQAANTPFELTEINLPIAGEGEVLVRIIASGVSPLDNKIRTGGGAHAEQALPAF